MEVTPGDFSKEKLSFPCCQQVTSPGGGIFTEQRLSAELWEKSSTEVSAGGAGQEFGVLALMWPRAFPAKFRILILTFLSAQGGISLGSLAIPN